jgi:hypothetical protein
VFLGHSEEASPDLKPFRLSPCDPEVPFWQFYLCHLHAHLAQWEQAIEWRGKSIASGNTSMFPFVGSGEFRMRRFAHNLRWKQ